MDRLTQAVETALGSTTAVVIGRARRRRRPGLRRASSPTVDGSSPRRTPTRRAGFFTTEAERAALAGRRGAPCAVPTVLAVVGRRCHRPTVPRPRVDRGRTGGPIDRGRSRSRRWPACTRPTPPCFGREDRRTTGSRGLPNEPSPSWAEFYGTQRLLPAGPARPGRRRAVCDRGIAALERLADPDRLAAARGRGRAAGASPRRPLGGQPARGRARRQLAHRSRRPRRPSRVRPGDDAPVRWLR